MDILTLLNQARAAGLSVKAQGERLDIEGPEQAAAIAQELGRQKAAVLAVLVAEAQPGSTGCREVKADTDVGRKSEDCPSAQRCTTISRSTILPQSPSKNAPGKIDHGGKTYEVAVISGTWFFRAAAEAGWTDCSDEFAGIVEERLQATSSCFDDRGNSAAGKKES